MAVGVTRERFEELVDQALESVPTQLLDMVDNVLIEVEEDPPEGEHLLGLYEGIPLTERGDYAGVLPDVIWVFMNPILEICSNEEHVAEEVRVTLIHELAHHFGIEDDRLEDLGWG